MRAEELWQELITKNPSYKGRTYEAWAYGAAPDELARLTLEGTKTATSSGYELYALEGEELPQVGMLNIILDGSGNAVCVTEAIEINILPYEDVSEVFAYCEGEGDRTLRYWREVHWDFFQKAYTKEGIPFTESSLVVCETFKKIYPI